MASNDGKKIIVRNRKARHEYEILETLEAGLALKGPEVKSLRAGDVSLREAFARIEDGEAWLHQMHVKPYDAANRWNAEPTRRRKLLLRSREIRRLGAEVEQKGLTLVPLDLYFRRGYAKVTLALGRGKKRHDKRAKKKRQTHEREMERAMRRAEQ